MQAPHILPYFALGEVTGDRLSVPEIEALLDMIDPVHGLLECGRLSRVLSLEGHINHPIQNEAANRAIDLHWRSKVVAAYRGYGYPPIVYHERVLRCLLLRFIARLPRRPVPVPLKINFDLGSAARLALAATALNDHLGAQSIDERESTSKRHMGWTVKEMGLNTHADLLTRLGRSRVLCAALADHHYPADEVDDAFGVDLPAYVQRLTWIISLLCTRDSNAFANIRESQFSSLSGDQASSTCAVLRDLSNDPQSLNASNGILPLLDISVFDTTPFLDLGDGHFMLCSLGALLDQLGAGLRAHVLRRAPERSRGAVNNAWGHAMEDVLLQPLADAIQRHQLLDVVVERSRELDLAVSNARACLLFELKSPLFLRDRVEADPDSNPEQWARTAIAGADSRSGALKQLRRHVEHLRAGRLAIRGRTVPATHEAVPIVTLAVPLHHKVAQNWLDDVCSSSERWPWSGIRPLCLPAQEIEALASLAESGVDPFKLLGGIAAGSITASIQDVAQQRGVPLCPAAFRSAGEAAFDSAIAAIATNRE